MNTLITDLNVIFSWILQVSWQTAVLTALVLTAQLIFRTKLSPAWRYGLWMLVVVRLLMPFSPQSAFSIFNLSRSIPLRLATHPVVLPQAIAADSTIPEKQPLFPTSRGQTPQLQSEIRVPTPEPGAVPNAADRVEQQPELNGRTDWFRVASLVWFGGVCLLGLRLFLANYLFRLRLARHTPVSDQRVCHLVNECAKALCVAHTVTVIETEAVRSPAVYGLRRKWLLLPDGMFERFSGTELRHVFMHEFAHLKRRDLEVNWLVTILQVLHWFNPLLWLAFARIRADRELATDALALSHACESENIPYGETILKLLEGSAHTTIQPGLVGIAESKARLKERLREIARRGSVKPWHWAALGLAVVITGVGLTDAQQSKPASPQGSPTAISHLESPGQHREAASDNTQSNSRSFAIRVMDHDTGAPLVGVNVIYTLKYHSGDSRKMELLTGGDGRAPIQFPATDLTSLAYQAEKTNYLALQGEWVNQELSLLKDEYEIKLSPGVVIGGTVTDEAGHPIANAEVTFDRPVSMLLSAGHARVDHAEMWTAPSDKPIATTDVNGKWRAACIWPGVSWASLRVHHQDFADATCSTEINSAMEAEGKVMKVSFGDLQKERVRLTLNKGTVVRGRVVNEAGEPLSGMEVNWAELMTSPHSRDQLLGQRTLKTDTAGKFTIEHAPAKHLFLWVQTSEYSPAVAEGDPASGSEIELRLTKGVPLQGEVLDGKSTNPVLGAHVAFADFGIWRGIHWEAVTDDQGRFAWSHAPSERFQLQIEKDGFITQGKIVQVRTNQLTIRLARNLHITGSVLDAQTRKPIKDFLVDWLDRGDPADFERGYHIVTVPGSNGVYSLDLGRLYADTWLGGYAHQCVFRVRADGYAPVISRVFSSRSDTGNVSSDVELKPVSQISGTVLDARGQPVAGAQVALKVPGSKLLLSGKPLFSSGMDGSFQLTDAQGHFKLNANGAAQGLVAVHQEGAAELGTNEFSDNLTIKLQPWGRIEGTVWEYSNLVTNQGVWASSATATWPESLAISFQTNSDLQGKFAFDFVPPGKFRVFRMIPTGRGSMGGPAKSVEVLPGTTSTIKLGGEGRPVIGHFKITNPYVAVDWQGNNMFFARSVLPQPPKGLKTEQDFDAWQKRPEIQRAYDAMQNYPMRVMTDGSFRMDEVMPGKYDMQIQILDPRDPDAFAYSKYIARTNLSFTVPETDTNTDGTAPLDIGVLNISLKPDFKSGQTAAPEFEATDMNGHKLKLSDFRGKYVLLDFWATWCGPCVGELPYLKQVQEKFKNRQDFTIVSLSLDKSVDDLRAFLAKNDLPWTQAYLGDWSGTGVPTAYGVQGIPALFLINPDGKIIESGLEGGSMIAKLQSHLK